MHEKNIKLIVRRQLKKQFPGWHKLTKKEKRALAKQVLAEALSKYDLGVTILGHR